MAHSRQGSAPRIPFVTPIIPSKAYNDPAPQTASQSPPVQPSSATKSARSQGPSLNVITGFDNPRTPPAPGHSFKPATKHDRNPSLQERRAAAGTEKEGMVGAKRSVHTELSPSDGTVLIGFDEALKKLNIQTSQSSERRLNIQTHTEHLVSPIAPSIIVTGVPREGEDMSDMFLRPIDPRHRSSIYSQSTNVRQTPAQQRDSGSTAPPVPALPRGLLDADETNLHNVESSRVTSWNTDISDDEDDRSATYVGSVLPVKDDMKISLLERSDTITTSRSQGWWNAITTPFLPQRSATIDKSFPRSPAPPPSSHSSPRPSPQPSPQPSNLSGSGQDLSEANVAMLASDNTASSLNPTTPHLADEKRQTIGFFGDATPKTATFPPVPPLPEPEKALKSPEFVDPGGFGLAAEYFEACLHDDHKTEPFYSCIMHDCSEWAHKDAIADARSRELFLASLEVDRVNQSHAMSEMAPVQANGSEDKALPAVPAISTPGLVSNSPSIVDHVHPADSVSQVAERRAAVDAIKAASTTRGIREIENRSADRQTIFSDSIGSPEVAEATAMPMIRAITPEPMHVSESRSISPAPAQPRVAHVARTMVAPAQKSMPAPPPASSVPRDMSVTNPGPVPVSTAPPVPTIVTRPPYPESVGSNTPVQYVPPPPPPLPVASAPYPEASRMPPTSFTPLGANSDNLALFQHTATRSVSPAPPQTNHAAYHASSAQPPAGYAFDHESDVGVARAMPGPSTSEPPAHLNHAQNFHTAPSPDLQAERGAPTVVSSRNPFKRQPPPPLSVAHSPQPQEAVSPGAITPRMARDAEIGNAVPMKSSHQTGLARAPSMADGSTAGSTRPSPFTRRGVMEQYDVKRPSPDPNTQSRNIVVHEGSGLNPQREASPGEYAHPGVQQHYGMPAPVFFPGPHNEPYNDVEASRAMNEKHGDELPPRPAKKPSKLGLVLATWKANRRLRPQKTKEQKKKRRCCCFIFFGLFALTLLIVLLIMFLHIPRADIPAQSSWLNLTNYPPIPTGVATIARPNAVLEQSGCVAPQTMWSCAVPREQQDGIKPNAPNQPNFRLEIRFQNGTSLSNGTTRSNSKRTALYGRDSYSASLWNPSPAPPSEDDQIFMGNTTDHNSAPYDGEQTPFFITFLPTTTTTNQKRDLDRRDTSSASASSSSSSPSSSSTSSSTDFFPDLTSAIPSPATNADGSAASATLIPLPTAQPLRLYNRNLPTEHYGFYTYFDRSIFLTSTTLTNTTHSASPDTPGGSSASTATHRCTWSQTRLLIQIWTGGPGELGNAQRPLINGSATAEAAAAGNITSKSWGNFVQPGSFPYPVTVTVDRHGGVAKDKMVYCYGLDGPGGKVNVTDKKISLEDRGFGGSLIANPGGFLANATASGERPIDGGTGGCGCVWQNWQSI